MSSTVVTREGLFTLGANEAGRMPLLVQGGDVVFGDGFVASSTPEMMK